MNLKFYYYTFNDELFPTVEINDYDILSMYLLDNGGCFLSYIDFLEECISNIKDSLEFDMSSNSYGVIKKDNNIIIYSLYDEDEYISIRLDDFIKSLQLWLTFVKKEPNKNYKEYHTI